MQAYSIYILNTKCMIFFENSISEKDIVKKKVVIFVNWVFHRKNWVIDMGKWQAIICWKGTPFVQTIPSTVFRIGIFFFLQISRTYLYVRVVHITLTSFDFCLICKKNPAVVFHIFFVFHVNCTNIRDVYITLIFDNLCKNIPAVELSLFFFFAKYCM